MSGYYQPTTGKPAYLRILGKRITWHEAGREVYDKLIYEVGEFGEADFRLVEASGREEYNLRLTHLSEEEEEEEDSKQERGIISEDGERWDLMFSALWDFSLVFSQDLFPRRTIYRNSPEDHRGRGRRDRKVG